MKVLFLDIDGVLNSTKTCVACGGYPMELNHLGAFDGFAVKLIQRLCDSAGVQVVLSSAWRLHHAHDEVGKAFGLPIVDRTPYLLGRPRGEEIADWLQRHPEVDSYAILDDDDDMLPEQRPLFVKTDAHEGLTWADFVKLCSLFGESAYAGAPRSREWRSGSTRLDWSDAP